MPLTAWSTPNLQDKAAGLHSSFTYQLRRVGREADVAVLQAGSEFAGRRPTTGRLPQLQPLLCLAAPQREVQQLGVLRAHGKVVKSYLGGPDGIPSR